MKSKYLVIIVLRLFAIIYAAIYTIPSIISGLSVLSAGRVSGSKMIPYYIMLLTVIVIPIIIWFTAEFLSSRIIHSKDEGENHINLGSADLLSVIIIAVGLILAVSSLPVIISDLFSKLFYGGAVNMPYAFRGSVRSNTGSGLITSLVEFIIGDILMIFNKNISGFMSSLGAAESKES